MANDARGSLMRTEDYVKIANNAEARLSNIDQVDPELSSANIIVTGVDEGKDTVLRFY